jgi:peptidoglycan-associated lipoprotein
MDSQGLGEDLLTTAPDGETGPLADIYFGFDQTTLTPEAQATLERHALWLQTYRDLRVTLEGHCDERGTVEYNLALGDQRGQVAYEYLVGLGVSPDRLTTVSFGKERPVDPGHNEAAWARNRRVHFVVSR